MAGADDTTPRVGVVTVAYRSESVLPGFLGSIPNASAHPLAVVVVDNAASPETRDLTRDYGGYYVERADNPGYGSAMNAGAATFGPGIAWILLSNPDVVLSPGVVDALAAVGDSDPAIGSVGPAVLDPDGTVYPSARAVPSIRNGIGHALFANLWHDNPWSAAYLRERESGRRDAGWLSGSCLLVRRSAFDEIGGFDERYFMYFEDVDLGFRLGRAGYRNVYEPSVAITHSGAHSTSGASRRMILAHHESARKFLTVKYPGRMLWPVRAVLSAGLTVRSRLVTRGLAE